MRASVRWAEHSQMNHTPAGPCQLHHPKTFNLFSVPSPHRCQHNCPWQPGPLAGPGLAASCKYNQEDREGSLKSTYWTKSFLKAAELSSTATLKCWRRSILIPAPMTLLSGLQPNPASSWVSQRRETLAPFPSFPFPGQRRLSFCIGAARWPCHLLRCLAGTS